MINAALRVGRHGLPGGDSLAQLLARKRGVHNRKGQPKLTEDQILHWARAYRKRTGTWPRISSGPIEEAPGETWLKVDSLLRYGSRGLAGRSSLRALLSARVGVRISHGEEALSEVQILAWADAHYFATGTWPTFNTRVRIAATGRLWSTVYLILRRGGRGLPGGDSLKELLVRHGRLVKVGKGQRPAPRT
jgi:hypothetical protein